MYPVMLSAGEECRSGGRAQCCGVELVVRQSLIGGALESGRWHRAPNVDIEPKPTSSSMMSSTFGAFVGAERCENNAGVESESSRWMSPANGCDE